MFGTRALATFALFVATARGVDAVFETVRDEDNAGGLRRSHDNVNRVLDGDQAKNENVTSSFSMHHDAEDLTEDHDVAIDDTVANSSDGRIDEAVVVSTSLEAGRELSSNHYNGPKASYVGCFVDNDTRVLDQFIGYPMSTEECIDACRLSISVDGLQAKSAYAYAGLQASGHCFCGNTHDTLGQVGDGECNQACQKGDYMCGGPWRNSVYSLVEDAKGDIIDQGAFYMGCFSDDGNRALDLYLGVGFSLNRCIQACRQENHFFAGRANRGDAGSAPPKRSTLAGTISSRDQ